MVCTQKRQNGTRLLAASAAAHLPRGCGGEASSPPWGAVGRLRPCEMAGEAALSLAPEALESGGRALVRRVLRNTPGGRILRERAAFEQLRKDAPSIFGTPTREAAQRQFEQVAAAGVRLRADDIVGFFSDISPEAKRDIFWRVRLAASGPDFPPDFGARMVQKLRAVLGEEDAARIVGLPMADVQQFRSQVRIAAEKSSPGAVRDELFAFKDALDRMVDRAIGVSRMAKDAPQMSQTLQNARHAWAVWRASEDLDSLIVKHSRPVRGIPGARRLNLEFFEDALFKRKKAQAGTGWHGTSTVRSTGCPEPGRSFRSGADAPRASYPQAWRSGPWLQFVPGSDQP